MAGFLGRLFSGNDSRGEEAARQLLTLRDRARQRRDLSLLHVVKAYQFTSKGTKAWVVVDGHTDRLDSWFWNARVDNGQTVLATTSAGSGAHHNRDHVIYVGQQGSSGVLAVLPAGTNAAAERYLRRKSGPAGAAATPPSCSQSSTSTQGPRSPSQVGLRFVPSADTAWRVVVDGQVITEVYKDYAAAVAAADALRGGGRYWAKRYGQTCEAVEGHPGQHINYKDGHSRQPFMRWATDELN